MVHRFDRLQNAHGVVKILTSSDQGFYILRETGSTIADAGINKRVPDTGITANAVAHSVNIGANRETNDRVGDYIAGLEAFNGVASYFTVNISSPNTPGLRDLQAPKADIAEQDIAPICDRIVAHNVDGIAVSNTTITRPGVTGSTARQAGGLSGRPLFKRSTGMLARIFQETKGQVPLIGIGGIDSGETALAKIEAGARLIQLYTGLIYEGWGLIPRIKQHLGEACQEAGVASIAQLSGRRAEHWAQQPLD